MTLLAPPAHFIEANCRGRTDQRKAGRERKQERQHVVAEGEPHQSDADDWVDEAEEDNVCPARLEIAKTFKQDLFEVSGADMADRERRGMPALPAPQQRKTQRSHVQSRKPNVVRCPFDRISDVLSHLRFSQGVRRAPLGRPLNQDSWMNAEPKMHCSNSSSDREGLP